MWIMGQGTYTHILVMFWIPDVWTMSYCLYIVYYGCKKELKMRSVLSECFSGCFFNPFFYICIYNISGHQTAGKSQRPDCYCRQSPHRHQAGSNRPWWGTCANVKLRRCLWVVSLNPRITCSASIYDGFTSSPQSLSIHLTSTKGPIDVLLCPDDDSDPKSPVKNGGTDINGNSPFLKVLQGLLQILSFFVELNISLRN